jgi:hypothetical protein
VLVLNAQVVESRAQAPKAHAKNCGGACPCAKDACTSAGDLCTSCGGACTHAEVPMRSPPEADTCPLSRSPKRHKTSPQVGHVATTMLPPSPRVTMGGHVATIIVPPSSCHHHCVLPWAVMLPPSSCHHHRAIFIVPPSSRVTMGGHVATIMLPPTHATQHCHTTHPASARVLQLVAALVLQHTGHCVGACGRVGLIRKHHLHTQEHTHTHTYGPMLYGQRHQ